MIKSFKDFDDELKGQKIYEAEVINDVREEEDTTYREDDIDVPEMISDNKFLLKISTIVLKKLKSSDLGNFGVYPTIINIDNVPGVYFYNYDDETMNIVICRDTYGKHVYLFKKFEMGSENVADLVLSSTKLGFNNIITKMISYLSSDSIEEGLIFEWVESLYNTNVTEKDVKLVASMDVEIRKKIRELYIAPLGTKVNVNNVMKRILAGRAAGDPDFIDICDEISDVFNKGNGFKDGHLKRVAIVFAFAMGIATPQSADSMDDIAEVLKGTVDDNGGDNDDFEDGNDEITITKGKTVPVVDKSEDKEEARKKRKAEKTKKDIEKYKNELHGIYRTTVAMCNYVKNNGNIDKNDSGWMTSRCMLITGKGATGKSKNVFQALRDMKMTRDRDYHNVTSASTAMKSLYKQFYDYNGKLLIFDDSNDLFKQGYQRSFWKNAFQTEDDNTPSIVQLPVNPNSDIKSQTANTYDPTNLSRQERYYNEIGRSSQEEMLKKLREFKAELSMKNPTASPSEITALANMEWEAYEEKKKPLMPVTFKYNGVVIIISNATREQLKNEIGEQDWGAIKSRMINYNLEPESYSIWAEIKEIIERERDMSESDLSSELCLIPRDIADEFIAEVESHLEDPNYCEMNFRIAKSMHKILNGPETKKIWKNKLEDYMNVNM